MNIKRLIVLSMAILYFCKACQLGILENTKTDLRKLQHHATAWDLLSMIFKSEESVIVVKENFIKEDVEWYGTFIRLLQMKLSISVSVIEIGEPREGAMITEALNEYRRIKSTAYILVSDNIELFSNFLHEIKASMKKWHSRSTFVITTYDGNLANFHKIFQFIWTTYGFGKLISFDTESGEAAAYNFLRDTMKVLNISNVVETFALYDRKVRLDGYPIRVTRLHNPPTVIAIPNSTRFGGIDPTILDTLQTRMNFTAIPYQPTYLDRFGNVKSTGRMRNIIYQLANGEVDISAYMTFITSLVVSGIDFTAPFCSEEIYFVVPKAGKVPPWLSMWEIFDKEIWIPTTCLFAISVLLRLCISINYENSRIGCEIVSKTFLNVLFILTGQPVSIRSADKFTTRSLVICGSIFAVNMGSCFTGHLLKRFSQVDYYPDINSFSDLNRSGLPLMRGSDGIVNAVNGTQHTTLNDLLKKMDVDSDINTAFDFKNGIPDHAILTHDSRMKYELANLAIKNNGTVSLHIVEQSLGRFSMAYMVRQDWFFLTNFNFHIHSIVEAGLIEKWFDDLRFELAHRMHRSEYESSEKHPRAFKLFDLCLAWYLLYIGFPISFVTFLIEIAWHSKTKRKIRVLKTLR